jgi:AcrR family transcriptional regulator
MAIPLRKGEATRAAILDEALALASQVGLEGLSIGELARRLGMSKSGLFAHFASKENLQLEVLRSAADRFVETVIRPALEQPRGEPRVRALFENWLGWARADFSPGGCLFVSAAVELDDRPGAPRDFLVGAQRDFLGAIATAARISVEEGHFRRDLDPEQFAYDLYSIYLAYHHFSRLLRSPEAEARLRRSFAELLERAKA